MGRGVIKEPDGIVTAWSSQALAKHWVDRSQGLDAAGVAEALIFAGQIVERPWT